MLSKSKLSTSLKPGLREAAYKALMSTFIGITTQEQFDAVKDIANKFADKFADIASEKIAKSVHDYMDDLVINLSMAGPQALVVTGTSPAGPVTGTTSSPLVGTLTTKNQGILYERDFLP